MILLTSMLALPLGASPFKLVLQTSKPVYAPGEPVEISIKLRNSGSSKVVAARAGAPDYPHATLTERIFDPAGRPLRTYSALFYAQWMTPFQIGPSFFVQVPPHGTAEVARDKVFGFWPDGQPMLKTDNKPVAKLAPGKYRVNISYEFKRTLSPLRKDAWIEAWAKERLEKNPKASRMAAPGVHRFAPGAKALYDRAAETKLTASATFEVK